MSPELRDVLNRLTKYESEGLSVTGLSVAQAWLDRYEQERTSLGLDTPPISLVNGSWSGLASG